MKKEVEIIGWYRDKYKFKEKEDRLKSMVHIVCLRIGKMFITNCGKTYSNKIDAFVEGKVEYKNLEKHGNVCGLCKKVK